MAWAASNRRLALAVARRPVDLVGPPFVIDAPHILDGYHLAPAAPVDDGDGAGTVDLLDGVHRRGPRLDHVGAAAGRERQPRGERSWGSSLRPDNLRVGDSEKPRPYVLGRSGPRQRAEQRDGI